MLVVIKVVPQIVNWDQKQSKTQIWCSFQVHSVSRWCGLVFAGMCGEMFGQTWFWDEI